MHCLKLRGLGHGLGLFEILQIQLSTDGGGTQNCVVGDSILSVWVMGAHVVKCGVNAYFLFLFFLFIL